jgi:signal transduction histidine kinase
VTAASPGASRSTLRPSGLVALVLGGILLGALSTWLAFGPGRLADAAPRLVVGWTAMGCGIAAIWRVRWSRCGPLLYATGALWFVTGLSVCLNIEPISHRCLDPGTVGRLAAAGSWLWLGAQVHGVATFPTGRVRSWPDGVAVLTGYGACLAIPAVTTPATLVVAMVLAFAPALRWRGARASDRPDLAPSVVVGAALALVLLLKDVLPPYGFELAIALSCVGLLAGVLAADDRRRALSADRAVRLGDALASVLGDPDLRVVFRATSVDGWLDTAGQTATPPRAGEGWAVTPVERDGIVLALIGHDPATLLDPDVRAAVTMAVELAAHNVRLRHELDDQLAAVAASRRRLVGAALRERGDLAARVDAEVEGRLADLAHQLARTRRSDTDPTVADHVRTAAEQLDLARGEVGDLAHGLYPAALRSGGLEGALRELVVRAPSRVTLDVADGASGKADADATVYFVCAEALANAARHAPGSSVRISVIRSGSALAVTVADDGPGGADPAGGTGLRGLRDRVEALGGTLTIDSQAGMGTRLAATIPVTREARAID